MNQVFTSQLGFKIRKTNVGAQKIDNTTWKIYGIVVSIFSMSDKDGKEKFFEKNFLLADVNLDIILKMLFLIMSNANINFQA